jgi:transcription elongation factor Elf1
MTNISRSEDAEKTELTYRPIEAVYSGHQLRIIPSDPFYEPSPDMQDACLGLLIERLRKNEVTSTLYKEVSFIDPGQNFEAVICDRCGQEMDMEAWQTRMDVAHETRFTDLSIVTPCCNKPSSLNDLKYQGPAGFARYVITVIDTPVEVDAEVLSELELVLGTKVKTIHVDV